MKRKHEMFWNNNYEWLNTWYGIKSDSDRYCGSDFVEANGRVFFKAKLSTILGDTEYTLSYITDTFEFEKNKIEQASSRDFMIGFVKPMSDKLTIIDSIPNENDEINKTSISISKNHIYWIENQRKLGGGREITLASASVKYSDKYETTYNTIVVNNIESDATIKLVIVPHNIDNSESTFLFAEKENSTNNLYALDKDCNCRKLAEYEALLGYNEDFIYLRNDSDVIIIKRCDSSQISISEFLPEIMNLVYGDAQNINNILDKIAYVDSARDELFLYENQSAKHPGKGALIGVLLDLKKPGILSIKERISCPEVCANKENPLIFDGYKYVWKMNSLWKGYKIYRKDGSLQEQFIVDEDNEKKNSPVIFSSPTVIFVEWNSNTDDSYGDCLAYSTNKGLCQMFRLDNDSEIKVVFQEESEERDF